MTVVRRVFRGEATDALWSEAEDAFARGDAATALRIFTGLAERGEWLAYPEVGNLLELGIGGVAKDIEGALYWYRKAIFESGDPNAHFAMARLYWSGTDVVADHQKAYEHVRQALAGKEPHRLIDHYRPMAYVMLGTMYARGLGIEKDIDKARAVLEEGTAAGYIWPMLELSKLEFKCWHLIRSFNLRITASRLAGKIYASDPTDVRLTGLNLPPVSK